MMNNLDLKSNFAKISNDHFIQINDELDSALKIGKYDNKFAFVVRGRTNRIKFKSSAFVTLLLSHLDVNEKQLVFLLEKDSLLDVFIKLIEDIKQSLKDIKISNKLDLAYSRWLLWKELFSSGNNGLLTENKIKGLMGELLFLDQVMMKYFSQKEAITSWGGANYNKKDFEFNKTWCEIKTTLNSNTRIKISSLEQLNAKNIGYLVVTNLQKSTRNEVSINLNDLIDKILKKIIIPELVDIFVNKLSQQGYAYSESYYDYSYILVSRKFYLVDDKFPKLTIKNIPVEITDAQYTIESLLLNNYMINESEVFGDARTTTTI